MNKLYVNPKKKGESYKKYFLFSISISSIKRKHISLTTSFISHFTQDDDYSFSNYNFSIGDDAIEYISGLYFPFEPLVGSNIKFNVWMTSVH